MIGNNEDGWLLYSKDDINRNTRQFYTTFADFLQENQSAVSKDRYDKATIVSTLKEQDKAMQEYGDKIYTREYSLVEKIDKSGEVRQNCADLVADIIGKAGNVLIGKPKILSGSRSRPGPYTWNNIFFEKGEIMSPINTKITWPNQQAYEFSIENNSYNLELP
jgi:hypothetical protein